MSVVNVVSSSEANQVARSSHRHCVQYVITILGELAAPLMRKA